MKSDAVRRLVIKDSQGSPSLDRALTRLGAIDGDETQMFACAGAWIWDPYGSLARSILMAAHASPALREIWVVGMEAQGNAGAKWCVPSVARTPLPIDHTIRYLLNAESRISAAEWFVVQPCTATRIRETANLLQAHPLLPPGISVSGFIFDPDADSLIPALERSHSS